VFGVEASTRILFAKVHEKDWSALKTFLIYTSAMPDIVYGIRGKDIHSTDIKLDWNIVNILRKL
jgi:methyl coenzyme M reductase gamma subunit